MIDFSLEREFSFWKQAHMRGIVLGALLSFYCDLINTGTISTNEMADAMAKVKLAEIMCDKSRFNKLYERTWSVYQKSCI